MNTGNVLLGVLAGVAVGATLGILFAPEKGSSTRKKICKKSEEYADDLGEKFDDLIDTITRKFEAVKEEAFRMAKEVKNKVEDAEAEVITNAK